MSKSPGEAHRGHAHPPAQAHLAKLTGGHAHPPAQVHLAKPTSGLPGLSETRSVAGQGHPNTEGVMGDLGSDPEQGKDCGNRKVMVITDTIYRVATGPGTVHVSSITIAVKLVKKVS